MSNGNTLYLECRSGISGDMTVAALLDLGATEENLRAELAKLPVDGYEDVYKRQLKQCISSIEKSWNFKFTEESFHSMLEMCIRDRLWAGIRGRPLLTSWRRL